VTFCYPLFELFNRTRTPKVKPIQQHIPRWHLDEESPESVAQLGFTASTSQRCLLPAAHTGTLPRMMRIQTNRPVHVRFGDADVVTSTADRTVCDYEVIEVPAEATHVSAFAASGLEGSIIVWRMHAEGVQQ